MGWVQFFLLFIFFPMFASAGVISGGGGRGIVCRDQADQITSAEMLDLYEGRVLYGLQVTPSDASMEVQIDEALKRFPETSRYLVEAYVRKVQQHMRLTPPKTDLTPIDDSFETAVPRNCKPEQLANYFNDELILVNFDIWEKLNPTHRAALILHEAFYAVERIFGATDSRRSRHVIAEIFDGRTKWVDPKEGVPKDALTCAGSKSVLMAWVYRNDSGTWTMQFQVVGHSYVMSRKTVQFSGNLDFNEAKTFPMEKGDDLLGTGQTITSTAESIFEKGDLVTLKRTWEHVIDIDGNKVPGYQTLRYYLTWKSGTYPGTEMPEQFLNCSFVIGVQQ